MRAGEELGDEVAEMLMLLGIKRANGNFGRGPGNADCGEPYRERPVRGYAGERPGEKPEPVVEYPGNRQTGVGRWRQDQEPRVRGIRTVRT